MYFYLRKALHLFCFFNCQLSLFAGELSFYFFSYPNFKTTELVQVFKGLEKFRNDPDQERNKDTPRKSDRAKRKLKKKTQKTGWYLVLKK